MFICSDYTVKYNFLLQDSRDINLYGLRVSLTDFCDLHGLTGVRCNPYGYLWFLQIQTYIHSTLYIRTVVSLQWHHLCFVNTKVNDLWHNKLCFVCLLYMGVLQRDPIPKLSFAMVLTICKDFVLQIVRIFCHDLTEYRSCPRLTPLSDSICFSSKCSTTGVTKAVVCAILSVGWCI